MSSKGPAAEDVLTGEGLDFTIAVDAGVLRVEADFIPVSLSSGLWRKHQIHPDPYLGSQRIALDIRLGESLFLHSTATGKLFAALDPKLEAQTLAGKLPRIAPATLTDPALLAKEFRRIREQGFSKSNEESVEGIMGYAVPIRDGSDAIVAAIHASVLAKRATK